MGTYNPRAPEVLGPEWVAIRDEDITFSPAVNVVERGHTFYNDTSRTLNAGRFYLKELPPGAEQGQVYLVNVYPRGTEDQTGPVRRCVIPVNTVGVTGTFSTTPTVPILSGTSSDFANIVVNANTASKRADVFFAVNQYAQELKGKRILEVNILNEMSWNPVDTSSLLTAERFGEFAFGSQISLFTGGAGLQSIALLPDGFDQIVGATLNGTPSMLLVPDIIAEGMYGQARRTRLRLGEVNRLWQTPSTTFNQIAMPWRVEELQRFEASAGANRTWFRYEFGGSVRWLGEFWWGYTALEVVYCEERRVAFGGINTDFDNPGGQHPFDASTVSVTLRSPTSLTTSPTLPIGEYLVTVSAADMGDSPGIFEYPAERLTSSNPFPILNGLREYIEIPTHQGVRINVTHTDGETFTSETDHVLPQISLHDNTLATIPDPHGYGRLARAQVWEGVTATQDILSSAIPTDVTGTYSQGRFYARRFGDTTVPLRLAHTTTSAFFTVLTVDAFDQLEEIIDGWKEVTLRFDTNLPLHTASGTQNFTFQAQLEYAGNRWEVLGAYAGAVSGTPGNPFNLVTATQRLGSTTYGGITANADWMPQYAPPVSGTANDDTADLFLLLSQDPPFITGLAVTGLSQALTTYTECDGHSACCIPRTLHYNRVSWGRADGASIVATFSGDVTGGWGPTDTNQTWTPTSGGSAADYSEGDGSGRIDLPDSISRNIYVNGVTLTDFDIYATIRSPVTVGDTLTASIHARFDVALNNGYRFQTSFDDDGTIDISIQRITAGGATSLVASTNLFPSFGPLQPFHIRVQGVGTALRMKIWQDLDGEPTAWTITITDATYTSGSVGLRAIKAAGNTNLGAYLLYDNFTATGFVNGISQDAFGYYELQRYDVVEGEWKTIMKATNLGVTSFNDYEARVGIESRYRIRSVNALRFEGLWSSEVGRTLTEPGVTFQSCGTNRRGALIFTTNEVQDGSSNLAYAMTWDGTVEEDFSFIEAGSVQLQTMFDRDYQVAFHGTERGGEAFTRTLLLANAAIGNPRLANARSLRDLAWADLPYVCVRDDIGDRWLATIIVPADIARRNRRLYNAQLSVIEVTATPSPVDP